MLSRSGPPGEDETAGERLQQIVVQPAGEGLGGGAGRIAAHTRHDAEEDVLAHKKPREERDDRADLAADQRADPDADPGPEHRGGGRAEDERGDVAAVECEWDAAGLERDDPEEEAGALADEAEQEPHQQAREHLRHEQQRPLRCEEERRADRPVPELARHGHDADERGEERRDAADPEEIALLACLRERELAGRCSPGRGR